MSGIEAGLIQASDIEELNQIVAPWDLRMNQITPGRFDAKLDFAQIKGVFLTRERWSHRVVASGITPPNFLHLAGVCKASEMTYAGVEIGFDKVMCGLDAKTTDFATPDGADHWVMLIPVDQITDVLGQELASELLPLGQTLSCDPKIIRKLSILVTETISALGGNAWLYADAAVLNTIHARLIRAACQLLTHSKKDGDRSSGRRRYIACHRAIRLADKIDQRISVPKLAASLGVSRRSLEQGFRESFNLSPQFYFRRARLNGLHRTLRRARDDQTTVTNAALDWGFTELGRTAVEYRQMFGEAPSSTLKSQPREIVQTYLEVL